MTLKGGAPVLLFIAIIMVGCNNTTENLSTATAAADSAFKKISTEFLNGYLAWRPQTAVSLGLHQYDGKLADYSQSSINNELTRLKYFDEQLNSLDTAAFSPKIFYDYRILLLAIQGEIFRIEELEVFTKNPIVYASAIEVSNYIIRNFAPIEDRIRSIINIEQQTARIFAAARENLADSLAKPFIETAIQVAGGSVAFLKADLVIALKDVKNDTLMAAFASANKIAIDEINGFADYLKKVKLPRANNNYAIGTAKFKKMLLGEDINLSPEEILQIGLKELKKEQNAFNAAARIIDPAKSPVDVYRETEEEHPTAETLISDARKNLEAVRQFLIDKKIISIPSEVRARVDETPLFARAASSSSTEIPGPFEKNSTEAWYYITPVDTAWNDQQKEDWLAQFNFYTTDIVTLHETYPGHYVQFLHLNTSNATNIEKIFSSYAFVEGWAHYSEQMAIDEGYGDNGDSVQAAKYRIAQSGDALLRLCRLCISIKIHCQDMNLDEATKFFMDNCYQGDKLSRGEATRGTFDPEYLFYTLGKLQILKLREDYKKQEGDKYSLQKFNNAMVDNGMPPIRLLRERLLKDKSIWDDIL
ncbi:MAG: DUF885 domain-containing protein [Ferruginibacter sp.]